MKKAILSVLMTGSIAFAPVIVSADTVNPLTSAFVQVAADTITSNQPPATNDANPNDNAAAIGDDNNLAMPNGDPNDDMSGDDENADSAGLSSDDDSIAGPRSAGISNK